MRLGGKPVEFDKGKSGIAMASAEKLDLAKIDLYENRNLVRLNHSVLRYYTYQARANKGAYFESQ